MSKLIAFIGVGNMGCPMAENLMKAGKILKVFDVSKKINTPYPLKNPQTRKKREIAKIEEVMRKCNFW